MSPLAPFTSVALTSRAVTTTRVQETSRCCTFQQRQSKAVVTVFSVLLLTVTKADLQAIRVDCVQR